MVAGEKLSASPAKSRGATHRPSVSTGHSYWNPERHADVRLERGNDGGVGGHELPDPGGLSRPGPAAVHSAVRGKAHMRSMRRARFVFMAIACLVPAIASASPTASVETGLVRARKLLSLAHDQLSPENRELLEEKLSAAERALENYKRALAARTPADVGSARSPNQALVTGGTGLVASVESEASLIAKAEEEWQPEIIEYPASEASCPSS